MGTFNIIKKGFTYGFMDMSDYFIENCKNEKCLFENEYHPVKKTFSIIKIKNSNEFINLTIYETKNGVIEIPDGGEQDFLNGGYFLSRSYSNTYEGGLYTAESAKKILLSNNANEFMEAIKGIDLSGNHLVSDIDGNICYQQSGRLPIRKYSGLFPVEGWKKENEWKGFVEKSKLNSFCNPKEGFITTANNNMNTNETLSINLHMGPYRTERISNLLSRKNNFTIEDMKIIQNDIYSIQGERFLKILRPILIKESQNEYTKILLNWDFLYNKDSQGAFLFEKFYQKIQFEIWKRVFGDEITNHVVKKHLIIYYYHYFDNVILSHDMRYNSLLWKNQTQEETFTLVWRSFVEDNIEMKRFGDYSSSYIKNIFFAEVLSGKIGSLLGIHKGPYEMEGSRSTINQIQIIDYNNETRIVSGPSWRIITLLKHNYSLTSLPGGVSESFLSNLYTSELDSFYERRYKILN
jgi:penicillin G amidase